MLALDYILCGSPPTLLEHFDEPKVIPNTGDVVRVGGRHNRYRVSHREIKQYTHNGVNHETVAAYVVPFE